MKYRFWTRTGFRPYRVQVRRWYGWRTIYKSMFYDSAVNVLKTLRNEEQ